MADEDMQIIAQTDPQTLADWWCVLNGWDWPGGLPELEPDGGKYRHGSRRSVLMHAIEDRIDGPALLAALRVKRFSISLPSADRPGYWSLDSRRHTREEAFAEFSQAADALRAAGFPVADFTIEDVVASAVVPPGAHGGADDLAQPPYA